MRHVIRIERPVADTSLDGAGSGSWAFVAETRAEVQDELPSRALERQTSGVTMATGQSRVRMQWRPGITPDMRFLICRRQAGALIVERIVQIVTGPAELGRRDGLEFMVEEYRPAGNPA
ncbi:MAG: head-tail adaptor protein [Cupriavidus sp.]|nr:MAG: head-tail adaptor protein [Cupriavidus sp.]